MKWDIVPLVANAGCLAFNILADSLLPACFSAAAALGMIVGKLYYEIHMRRELARSGSSLNELFAVLHKELGR